MSVLGKSAPTRSLWQVLAAGVARLDDGALVRAIFFALLAGTAAVLFIDYQQLRAADAASIASPLAPVLPAFNPNSPDAQSGPEVTTDLELLKAPLTAILGAENTLELTGTIDPGASDRVAAEIAAHGEYIKTVALDSPGGSVPDALAIGTLIREKGFDTSVAAGALCASSCPLIFAGGKTRLITPRSALGVHQIYAALPAGQGFGVSAGNALSGAQKTTAEISRYLSALGVSPEIWLHALETPPEKLYYLSPDELIALKLATKLTK